MGGHEERLRNLAGSLRTLHIRTGEDYTGKSFVSRLRIQKCIYLLANLQYKPARAYRFSDYLRGPYAPSLSRDYYELAASEPHVDEAEIPERILAAVASATKEGILFLEAVTTLHSIWRYNKGASKEMVFSYVRRLKPHVSKLVEGAWEFLLDVGLVPTDT